MDAHCHRGGAERAEAGLSACGAASACAADSFYRPPCWAWQGRASLTFCPFFRFPVPRSLYCRPGRAGKPSGAAIAGEGGDLFQVMPAGSCGAVLPVCARPRPRHPMPKASRAPLQRPAAATRHKPAQASRAQSGLAGARSSSVPHVVPCGAARRLVGGLAP